MVLRGGVVASLILCSKDELVSVIIVIKSSS